MTNSKQNTVKIVEAMKKIQIKGVWHNLTSSHDASLIIVENRDTHLSDCEFRQLSNEELAHLKTNLPKWIK